jgi:hypothetical protein
MSAISRREFLARSRNRGLRFAAGVTLVGNAASVRGTPAADKFILAIVGMRGRGSSLAPDFAGRGDCQFAYTCDVNSVRFASWSKLIAVKQGGKTPRCVQDFRRALDDKSVDAMIIVTPVHWPHRI